MSKSQENYRKRRRILLNFLDSELVADILAKNVMYSSTRSFEKMIVSDNLPIQIVRHGNRLVVFRTDK